MYNCAIVLAAGKGKRMKSSMPKVIHKVCGKEMVNHVIDNVRKASIKDVNLIIGKGAKQVKEKTENRNVTYSMQEEQLGTGHAVICAEDFLKNKKGTVAIFTGDVPLITNETIEKLFEFHNNGQFSATLISSIIGEPTGYGRIVREKSGEVEKIIEHKDCNEEEIKINEINAGIYCFDIEVLLDSLKKLNNDNSQGEYYLTDVIEIMKTAGKKIGAIIVSYEEIMGVNSRVQLSEAETVMRKRINNKHMINGVTFIDDASTYIDEDVEIERDTIIYPGCIIQGNTIIKEGCTLYSNSRIFNSIIDSGVTIENSVILESHVGQGTTVGPFAYIRPETNIGKSARIGDFVEIKKSTIGDKTKVSHLTYIGDAEVGSGCNFGCGTVVVNYDGQKKYKTIIGNNAFIGCNTNLISPVKVNDNTYIAAGSTITDEIPEGALAIARVKQVNKQGWVQKKGLLKK